MADREDIVSGAFARVVHQSIPSRIRVPHALLAAMNWLEDDGHLLQASEGPSAVLLSPDEAVDAAPGACRTGFRPAVDVWGLEVPAEADRLVILINTGADGSGAGIWLDDDERPRYVHLGSGSGSTWSGVITDDPVDLLRLLAVGYDELCWPRDHDLAPDQAYAKGMGEEYPGGWVAPTAFRTWVRRTFNVTVPITAREIVPAPDAGHDPFAQWLERVR